MHGELSVEVAFDLVLHLFVQLGRRQPLVGAGVALQQVVSAAEVLPGARPQGGGDALATPAPNLPRSAAVSGRSAHHAGSGQPFHGS